MNFWWLLRRLLLSLSVPLTKWIGKAHAPFSHKRISAKHFRKAAGLIYPGCVLVARTRGEFSNMFIPCHFTHGAIYFESQIIIEAVGEGVRHCDLVDFMLKKDEIIILRPKFCTSDVMFEAANWAKSKIGVEYDYLFDSANESFYCFELVWAAYEAAAGEAMPVKKKSIIGLKTITGDDFLNKKYWQIIFDSRKEKT